MAYGRPKEEYHFWSEDTDKDTDMTSDENEWNSAQVMKQESAQRQLDSTRRALASLNESEQIGNATAEEVLQQGEQLDNIEKNTDHIIQSGKESQIYLNNIKSVFGGLKNWWHGKKDTTTSKGGEVEKTERNNTAADLRDSWSDPPVAGPAPSGFGVRQQHQQQQQQQHKPDSYDSQLTEDLSEMSSGLSRLKGLAMGLGTEMDKQNEQLDRLDAKSERANTIIKDQNRQMGQILKK